jgi:redox-sensitive bicupin YhaK (pirin superfamily)
MADVTRREALKIIAAAGAGASAAACSKTPPERAAKATPETTPDALLAVHEMAGLHWKTRDPFLFCAHHDDAYPKGNEQMGPAASLAGRRMGRDFAGKDGWRMYHGEVVPGFPQHPHRGFETVTVVRRGLLDHADSMGATARYGQGDVQWLTAGAGIQHAEMFPLLERDRANPLELFQIWLNLPKADKMVAPHFTMLWAPTIPRREIRDAAGKLTTLTVKAGAYQDMKPPAPPPNSWASRPEADVAIWTIDMDPGARFTLPAAKPGTDRTLYLYRGDGEVRISGQAVAVHHRVELKGDREISLHNGSGKVELLLLQGRPIGEPVAHRGPFVMNTMAEIRQAYADYQRTRFGGWPWDRADPVHARTEGRFALHADGRVERPS